MSDQTIEWTEKYRPRLLADIIGNKKALTELKAWAASWENGIPEKRAVILHGDAGTGKTSSAYALAHEVGWSVVELNASDQRNYDIIKQIAFRGAANETFTGSGAFISSKHGGRKLIILDEADSLFGSQDRGGLRAIVETIRVTQQPIILLMNDFYATRRKAPALATLSHVIQFYKVRQDSMTAALKRICAKEGIETTHEAVAALAAKSHGDMRSAINDLQAVAGGAARLSVADADSLGYRDVKDTMFDAVAHIFKTYRAGDARAALYDLNETPDMILLWIDENLPLEYAEAPDLMRGFDALSKSDIFLSRVSRRQHYRLWSYALDMMSAGVAVSKEQHYRGFRRYQFPKWLMKMSTSKGIRTTKKNISLKLGRMQHTSMRDVQADVLPLFKQIFQNDREFAVTMTMDLGFTDDELAFLFDEKTGGRRTKHLLQDIKNVEAAKEQGETVSFEAYEEKKTRKTPVAAPKRATPDPEPQESAQPPEKNQKNLFDF